MNAPPKPTVLILLRHGQSEWNHEGRWQGQAATVLSALGVTQAYCVGQRLANLAIDYIYTSDLPRSADTARIIGQYVGLTPDLRPSLRETDLGRWTGLTTAEIQQRYPAEWEAMLAGQEVRRGGGESYDEVIARTTAFVRGVVHDHPGQRLLIVSHGGAIRAMIAGALGLDLPTMHSLGMARNTAMTWLRYDRGKFFLDRYNDTAHLADHDT